MDTDKPLITTGVDITFDTPTVLKAALIVAVLAILAGVFLHFTTKVLSGK